MIFEKMGYFNILRISEIPRRHKMGYENLLAWTEENPYCTVGMRECIMLEIAELDSCQIYIKKIYEVSEF